MPWHRGELDNVGAKSRNRILAILPPLLPILRGLGKRARFTGPDDFVLVSRVGTPIDEHNIAPRRLKVVGKDLDMPWLS
jgi:hypothetical protein